MANYNRRRRHRQLQILLIFIIIALLFAITWVAFELIAPLFAPAPVVEEKPPAVEVGPTPLNSYNLENFSFENSLLTYDGQETWTGIDVSDHQGIIDWKQVADSGIDYAIIRVGYRGYTEGTITMDKYYRENLQGALAQGIPVGAYFFSQAITPEEAKEEAQILLDAIEGYPITYPLVFDWEDVVYPARTDDIGFTDLSEITRTFCDTVEDAGYIPSVYFNQTFGYQMFDLAELSHCVLWLAQYHQTPDFRYHFDMVQYTDKGTVPGIDTPVDINLSFWSPK